MPGIAGLITRMPRERAERELRRMVESLRHEAFYETGFWIDESLGVYLGWVVQKNAFADPMPVHSESGDVTLIFSGEEYPEPGTALRLKQRGHDVKGGGAGYLVHLYEEDQSFLATLNGIFHGLLIDRTRNTVTLFNDRYGMHRICYHESQDAFYFAAEAKAILAVCPALREVDPSSLGEFVAYSCVLDNRTIFKGINVLPQAAQWTFRNGVLEQKGMYFHPREWEDQEALTPAAYYLELRDAFSRNLSRYFNGHQPIGLALTGGLDTRAIMAWGKSRPGELPCYTFGGMIRNCQDVQIARRVARSCEQAHHVIEVGSEFLTRFSHYAERSTYLSEGGVDVARSPDLYVSEKARDIAPVKIVGTYGSEIMRHAVMLSPRAPLRSLYRPELLASVDRASNAYSRLDQQHPVTFAAFRQSPWYHSAVLGLEQSQLTVRSPYLDNEFVRTVYRAPRQGGAGKDIRSKLIRDGNPALSQIRTDRGVGGRSGRLSSMMTRGLLEFTFRAEYMYDFGMPQWLAKVDHVLAPLRFERLFLGRHKFSSFRVWYRDQLSNYVREVLLDRRTLSRPFLDPNAVKRVVKGHLTGASNHTMEIHKLLTLELLHRTLVDSR